MDKKLEEVFALCKRGSDGNTSGQKCNSNLAYNISQNGAHVVILKCAKCSYQWNTAVGGSFSL